MYNGVAASEILAGDQTWVLVLRAYPCNCVSCCGLGNRNLSKLIGWTYN